MAHMVETMAYTNAVPWHGLGTFLEPNTTLDQWLTQSGLDWAVSRRLVRMSENRQSSNLVPIPGYVAITRDSDNRVFQVASDRYKPIQNREMVNFFRRYCDEGAMNLETLGALKDGSIIWALASIDKAFSIGKDQNKAYLLLVNSHDGSHAFEVKFTGVRVVCWNTLSATAGTKAAFKSKHTRKAAGAMLGAKNAVDEAIGFFEGYQKMAQEMASFKISHNSNIAKRLIVEIANPDANDKVIPANTPVSRIEALMYRDSARVTDEELGRLGMALDAALYEQPGAELPSSKDTLWGVLNAVTFHVDHRARTRGGEAQDNRLTSAWFGSGERLKQRAVDVLSQAVLVSK